MLFDPANPGKKRLSCECCKNPWQSEGPVCGDCVDGETTTSGLDPANIDTSVAPGANFFEYANGGWRKQNPVPKEYPAWNTFFALHDANLSRLRELMESTDDVRVRKFWEAALDEDTIEARGLEALAPVLAACEEAAADPTAAIAALHRYGIAALIGVGEGPDDEKSSWTLLQLGQGGLGLPDRDYYLDDCHADKRELYEAFIRGTLERLDVADAAARAADVLAFETACAKSQLSMTEKRDPQITYNKYSVAKLAATCKGCVDWPRLLELLDVPRRDGDVNLNAPAAIATSVRLFGELDATVRVAYLKFHAAKSLSPHLPKAFVEAWFAFYGTALSGQQEQQPRWKRALGFVDAALGELVGKAYTTKYFPESSKKRCLDLVERVRQQLERRLKEVPWMTNTKTREHALEKMNKFGCKIGYPDEWRAYEGLIIKAGDHLGNILRARAHDHAVEMARVDAPTDLKKWEMLPHQINAYYHPNLNEIVSGPRPNVDRRRRSAARLDRRRRTTERRRLTIDSLCSRRSSPPPSCSRPSSTRRQTMPQTWAAWASLSATR
jgi:putative endopeptidase